jgi:hypothetical protein
VLPWRVVALWHNLLMRGTDKTLLGHLEVCGSCLIFDLDVGCSDDGSNGKEHDT